MYGGGTSDEGIPYSQESSKVSCVALRFGRVSRAGPRTATALGGARCLATAMTLSELSLRPLKAIGESAKYVVSFAVASALIVRQDLAPRRRSGKYIFRTKLQSKEASVTAARVVRERASRDRKETASRRRAELFRSENNTRSQQTRKRGTRRRTRGERAFRRRSSGWSARSWRLF